MTYYSPEMYTAIEEGDHSKLGVRLGAACVDAGIPIIALSKWFGVSRQAIYGWFRGTPMRDKYHEKAETIIGILLAALEDEALPVEDLETAMAIFKQYKSRAK